MNIVETIRSVAGFADKGTESINEYWQQVHFTKGECFAQTSKGGVCEPIDLSIACGVNAQKLLKALKAVKGDVRITKEADNFFIKSNDCSAKLSATVLNNAPKFFKPTAKKKDWQETDLLVEAKRLAWCVSDDPHRAHMQGICFGKNGMAATNGSALVQIEGDDFEKRFGETVLLPPNLLLDLPELCWVTKEENRVFIATQADKRSFRVLNIINAQFPPVFDLAARARKQKGARVGRTAFFDLIKRASLSNSMIVMEVKGDHLFVVVDENVTASLFGFLDAIPLIENEKIPEGKIGVDAKYLKPLVENATSDEIIIKMTPSEKGGIDAVYIEDDGYVGLVMPYRM